MSHFFSDIAYRSGVNFFLYESKEFDGPGLFQLGLRAEQGDTAFLDTASNEEEEVLRALGLPQKENFGPQDHAMVQFYHPVRNGSFRLIEATEGNGDETALAAEFHLPKCCAAYSQRLSPISWNKTAFSESAPKQRRPC